MQIALHPRVIVALHRVGRVIERGDEIRADIVDLARAPVKRGDDIFNMVMVKFEKTLLNGLLRQFLTVYANRFAAAANHVDHNRDDLVNFSDVNFQFGIIAVLIKKIVLDILPYQFTVITVFIGSLF